MNVQKPCSKCLNGMAHNAFPLLSQVMKPGHTFTASPMLLMERDQLLFDQISRVRSNCSPFFPTRRVQSWWTFYHRSQSSLQHTMLKLFYPKLLKSILQQRQTIGTSKTLVLHDNVSVRKAKVTVTFLKEHNVQHLTHPPLQASLGSM